MINAVCDSCGAEASVSRYGVAWQEGAHERCAARHGGSVSDQSALARCPPMADALKAAASRLNGEARE
jgi:hypothetical protein